MLLFNFLFVFYLMVLVNSYTISKSIAEYNFDDESDSLFDTDNTRGRKNRHDVFLHKFRREEKEGVTEPNGAKKTIVEVTTPTQTTKTPGAHEKTKAYHKFWRKFKMKNKKIKCDRMKRYKHKRITINPTYPNRITAHKNYRLSHDTKRKREASIIVGAKLNKKLTKDKKAGTSTTVDTPKTRSTLLSTSDEKTISDITTKLTSLKLKYGIDRHNFLPKINKVFYEYRPYTETTTVTTISTTEETEFPGTAQIEELLNDIKARAIQMMADQSPAITEILTNAATETTFEADPILTHVGVTGPGFALTTFVSLNSIDEVNKRTINDSNMVVISDKDSHNISVRSCKADAYTIAQNVEDLLQGQLKKIYKKVKSKVAKDYHKEVKTVQSTLSDEQKKVVDKIEKKVDEFIKSTKPPCKSNESTCKKSQNNTTLKPTKTPSTKTRLVRAGKVTKKMKKTTAHQKTTPSIDDFAMLTLYEQILAKTHEDNVMKMLTTSAFMNLGGRLSKRNATSDVTDANTIYDEIIVDNSMADNLTSEIPSQIPDNNDTGTSENVEETSYEGLVDKISFNDYVNGYKHYLNFQKDQAAANFSNLIKFQAHKHHKVDDIGKFILNKIPQIPTRKRRYFFDDSDIDYQDVSTKSDDSWFKKHFYMFIDNGPPKKYHTSETVNFKDVTGGNNNKVGFVSRSFDNSIEVVATESERGGTEEYNMEQENINLDDLSKVLEDRKHNLVPSANQVQQTPLETPKEHQLEEGGLAIKIYAPHVISKWFGNKQNQKLRKSAYNKGDDPFLDSDRLKRDVKLPNLVNMTNNFEVRSTMNAASHTDRSKAINNKKDGCVSIDVVSQPTSIVKLRSNTKPNKFKKLLKKLHLIRNKKKQKRQAKVRRYNPFKKLKNIIFKNNEDDRVMGISRGFNNDYDILNSHIDTFKPIRYNIPNMNDLRNQVPNITNDYALSYDDHLTTPGTMGHEDKVVDIAYERYTTPSFETKPETKPYTFGTHNPVRKFTTESPKTFTTETQKTTLRMTPFTDEIMNINIKSASNINQIVKSFKPNNDNHRMSLQDIKNEIERLNQRIYSHGTQPHYPMMTQPHLKTQTNAITTLNRKGLHMKPKPRVNNKPKIFPGKKPVDTPEKIEIKSDFPMLYKFDDYNLQEINGEISDRNVKNIIIDSEKGLSATELADIFQKSPEEIKLDKFKNRRDDFNDLLLWHGDILNYGALTSPSWQDILDSLQDNQLSTRNLIDMENELAEMNILLNNVKDINFVVAPKKDDMNKKSKSTNLLNTNKVKANNYNMIKRDDNNDEIFKTMTVVTENDKNEPKEYYTTKDYVKSNKASSRSRKEVYGPIVMDSTVLSYDDSVNFINVAPRKILSRSSLKPSKKKNKSSAKSKTNQQPIQSFSTPFPMTMGQFELFLKQNDLDVESVTSPLLEAPKLININHKPNTNVSTHDEVNKKTDNKDSDSKYPDNEPTNEIQDDLNPEDQIEYLNDQLDYLESDINYQNDNYNKHRKYSNKDATKRSATERNDAKEKEVEITIINFDDANKLFKDFHTLKSKFHETRVKTTAAVNNMFSTDQMKSDKNIIEINEGDRKHCKSTKIDEDPTGLHVYGHSFHYNFLFGPHKNHKGRLNGTKNKKHSTRKVFRDDNEDYRSRRLNDMDDVHRFGREASSSKTNNVISCIPDISSATCQAAATANEMWSKVLPILRNKLYFFVNDSKTNHRKEESNSTSKGNEKTISKATTQAMIIKEKNKIFGKEYIDKLNNVKEITTPLPYGVSVMENYRLMSTVTQKHKSKTKGSKKIEEMYVEQAPSDDMIYYELSLKKHPSKLKLNKKVTRETTTRFNHLLKEVRDLKSKLKRNVPAETYTAKDVAAIEVVVDLLKDTLNNVTKAVKYNLSKKDKTTTTNSIQVHIAIPYDMEDKKRAVDTQRIRKVFSAKMATPVDLEYQIHSIEEKNLTPSNGDVSLSPGMYLVVDNNTGTYSLKPVKCNKQSRDIHNHIKQSNISGKVALSKDFLATVNEQLLKLYENLTSTMNNHKIVSRTIHWDKIRKFFGHDRVCDCKCKANRTMCSACFASDDVVRELTMAFENLSKYMKDHCTEIQTFFWMNPTGGKNLRDLVNRIDGSLTDYYKRVKGKCQGRPCKAFSSYLDKRGVNKSQDEFNMFLDCIKELSQNIEMVLNNLPYDDALKDAGDKFVEATNDCARSIDKRRLQAKKPLRKQNQYSLDNINVNIICDPSARKSTEYKFDPNDLAEINTDNIIFRNKKNKFLKKLFPETTNPPKKLFTYYVSEDTAKMDKRDTFNNQLESPLIADTGGSFWHDYINKNNDLNTLIKSKNVKENTEMTKHTKSFKDKLIDMYPSKLFPTPRSKSKHEEQKVVEVAPTTTSQVTVEDILATRMESLSYNIEELMKIFEKVYQFESYKKEKQNHIDSTTHGKTTEHKRIKAKKIKKIHKMTTNKMHKKVETKKHKEHTKQKKTTKNDNKTNTTPKNEQININATEERPTPFRKMTITPDTTSGAPELSKTTPTWNKATDATLPIPNYNNATETILPTPNWNKQTATEAPISQESTIESKNTQNAHKNNLFQILKHVTAGFIDEIRQKITTMKPKHNREADILMTEMNTGQKTQVTVFTKGNNEQMNKITEASNQKNKETGEDNSESKSLLSQQINQNENKTSELTDKLNDKIILYDEIDPYTTTTELGSLIYKIENGQQHVISQELTTNSPSILIVTNELNVRNNYKGLFKSVLDFDYKLKRRNENQTMMDIEDIMLTYTAYPRSTTRKNRKEEKTTKHHKKNKDKETNKEADKNENNIDKEILLDTEYDLIDVLRKLHLPTSSKVKDNQSEAGGFTIRIIPDTTKNVNKGPCRSVGSKVTCQCGHYREELIVKQLRQQNFELPILKRCHENPYFSPIQLRVVVDRNRSRKSRRSRTITSRDVKNVALSKWIPKDAKPLRDTIFIWITGYVLLLILAVSVNLCCFANNN